MTPEKALEYQQVAALVCEDIEILVDIASNPNKTAEQLRAQIKLLKEQKDKLIADREHREMRYNAACVLYSIPKGMIRNDPVS